MNCISLNDTIMKYSLLKIIEMVTYSDLFNKDLVSKEKLMEEQKPA